MLPKGSILIDLRPICVDAPLMVLTSNGWKSAGKVYRGEERADDVVANRAMRKVVKGGMYTLLKRNYFEYIWYWDTLKDLEADVEGRWKGDIRISKEIWQLARQLYNNGSGPNRIRMPIRAKLAKYRKQ